MIARRELDTLVAEKVMGFQRHKTEPYWVTPSGDYLHTFKPSTDIAAAWSVVEKLNYSGDKYTRDFFLQKECIELSPRRWQWFAWFRKDSADQGIEYSAEADTAPLAICLAALKAVEP